MITAAVDGVWRPGIGDPTVWGWATALGYLLTCALCWHSFGRLRGRCGHVSTACGFWLAAAVVMLLLGVNKQLDLQIWLTQQGRQWAKAAGWYAHRRTVQKWFILGLAGSGTGTLAAAAWWLRRAAMAERIALCGGVLLMCFVMMRAVSFHHMDHWLGLQMGWANLNVILECSGIACVLLGAAIRHRQPARAPTAATTVVRPWQWAGAHAGSNVYWKLLHRSAPTHRPPDSRRE